MAEGAFTGGKLNYWPIDTGGRHAKLPGEGDTPTVLDVANGLAMIDDHQAHGVEAFEGRRCSVAFFTIGSYAKAPRRDVALLQRLGVNYLKAKVSYSARCDKCCRTRQWVAGQSVGLPQAAPIRPLRASRQTEAWTSRTSP